MTTKRELWNMLYNERKEHERTIKELEKTKRLLRKYKKIAGRNKRVPDMNGTLVQYFRE